MRSSSILSVLTLLGSAVASFAPGPIRLQKREEIDLEELYPAYNLTGVPVDHFHNDSKYEPHSNETFNLRYFMDATHYKPGGPVILLHSGETSATDRLPFLQKGIVYQLCKATGGLGVIFEQRYYGTSFPVPDLETENMRFLDTAQTLADQAYFQQNVVFEGFEDQDLTAPKTPWIIYGGSYAGGIVSFMRKIYPDLVWGAIESSGVTVAIWDFWEYNEPIAKYANATCIETQRELIDAVDTLLLKKEPNTTAELKSAFNMAELTDDRDFANVVGWAMGNWQSRNWDPEVGSDDFEYYCGNITSSDNIWDQSDELAANVSALVEEAGHPASLAASMLNMIGWTNYSSVVTCEEESLNDCWGYSNESWSVYTDKSIDNQGSLCWPYQWCTEWGYVQTGSGVPEGEQPIVSRLLDLEYSSLICKYAFNLTEPADVDAVNKYGGYNISYPRLAHIGGEADVWRPASPLATLDVPTMLNVTSTQSEPIILIEGGVHHWDENGVFENETSPGVPPPAVADAQAKIAHFVQEWMVMWEQHCIDSPESCQ